MRKKALFGIGLLIIFCSVGWVVDKQRTSFTYDDRQYVSDDSCYTSEELCLDETENDIVNVQQSKLDSDIHENQTITADKENELSGSRLDGESDLSEERNTYTKDSVSKDSEATVATEDIKENNEDNQPVDGIVYPTPDPDKPYNDNPTTEQPDVDTTPKTDETDTSNASTTEADEPKKVWVPAVYENVWVVDTPEWTEEKAIYEEREAAECVKCHQILYTQAEVEAHGDLPACEPLQYRNYYYDVIVGTETIVHKEQGHYEKKLISEGHWE